MTDKELGQRIQQIREGRGLTQNDLAEVMGLQRATISQIETGKRTVRVSELEALARFFGLDFRAFLGEEALETQPLEVLFRAQPALGKSSRVVAALGHLRRLAVERVRLEKMLEVRFATSAPPEYREAVPSDQFDAVQQGNQVADEERRRLGLGAEPIPDVAELLESEGVRVLVTSLPEDISGLTMKDQEAGPIVAVAQGESWQRRRFSLAHEYGHVLLDQEPATVSQRSERKSLQEVRVNAFAAAFLLPETGVREFARNRGKGQTTRQEVYDGEDVVRARDRSGRKAIHLIDIVEMAHHFGVSRQAAIFRLHNLGLISAPTRDELLEKDRKGEGRQLERVLRLERAEPHSRAAETFRLRFFGLAVDAYRQIKISGGKLRELLGMIDMDPEDIDDIIAAERPPLTAEEMRLPESPV